MADSTIFDLTPETVLTSSHEFVAQDTSAATRAQAVPYSLMGGLEYTTSGDAAISAAVGKLYYVDVGSFTADRVLTLPATAAVGERVGVFVSTGDDTYELGIQANTGDTLNGVAAATDWSRLFISNECVIMRCVVADTTWIVEYDGRIPCKFSAYLSADQSYSAATWTQVEFDTEEFDVGSVFDVAASNWRCEPRRAGKWSFSLYLRNTVASSDGQTFGGRVVNGTTMILAQQVTNVGGTTSGEPGVSVAAFDLTSSDTASGQVYHDAAKSVDASFTAGSVPGRSRFTGTELL